MNIFNALLGRASGLQNKGTQPNYGSLIGATTGMPQIKEINGTLTPYADSRDTYLRTGYSYNDIVYMVIKMIVDKTCVPDWAPYDVVDETALKEFKKLQAAMHGMIGKPGLLNKAWTKLENLHYKALVPVKDDKLNALLDSPNPDSSMDKHHAMLFTSKLTFGGYMEQWFVPSGGLAGGYPTTLEYLPYQYMDIYTNREWPLRITGYQLRAWNLPKFIKEEIVHEAYQNLDWSEDGRHFYGQSPLKAALRRTQRSNESQKTGVAAFQNGGIRGITYLDIPSVVLEKDFDGSLTSNQINDLKARYEAINAGGSARAGSTTFSGYKVGFTATGLSPVDLDQMEMEKWDMRMISAVYGAPSQLFNDPDNKTFANEAEGNKALILRSCLPLLNNRELSFNQMLRTLPAYQNSKRVVTYDIKQYSELEENKKDLVAWLKDAQWMTFNEKRDEMGLPLRPEPSMDKIYVTSSLVNLEDLDVPLPEEGTGDDELDLDNQNDKNDNEQQ